MTKYKESKQIFVQEFPWASDTWPAHSSTGVNHRSLLPSCWRPSSLESSTRNKVNRSRLTLHIVKGLTMRITSMSQSGTANPARNTSDADRKYAENIRKKVDRFRILIVGRANAGKTTILKKICGTNEEPETYDSNGKKVWNLGCTFKWIVVLRTHYDQVDTVLRPSAEVILLILWGYHNLTIIIISVDCIVLIIKWCSEATPILYFMILVGLRLVPPLS